jgi:DNA-3-methyladenine glycosylase I
MTRCPWVTEDNELYQRYHDKEWGVPAHNDRTHFEFLVLEGAQAGLSWITVLKRREGYRQAFADFDAHKVAGFKERQIKLLMHNPGIIRNRAKITAAITNARQFLKIQQEFGSFDDYLWRFVDGEPIVHRLKLLADYPTTIPEAEALSKDLKKRGFSFVGPTIMYAHMQACGLVNDHTLDCFRREELLDD